MLVLGLSFSAQAQQPAPSMQNAAIIYDQPRPLVLVNEQETTTNAIILNPGDIDAVEVVKGANALERYGEKGKDGVIIMNLKQDLPLVRLQEVYKAFAVPEQQQQLTLAINGKHVKDPALLLADLRQIKKVEVADFEVASPTRWSFDEQYLNIITKPQH
jgi:hypothetical protein